MLAFEHLDARLQRSSQALSVIGSQAWIFGGEFISRQPLDDQIDVVDLAPEQEGMVEYALKVCDQYQSFAASVRTGQSRLSMTHPHRAQWKRILFLRGGVAPT